MSSIGATCAEKSNEYAAPTEFETLLADESTNMARQRRWVARIRNYFGTLVAPAKLGNGACPSITSWRWNNVAAQISKTLGRARIQSLMQ